jgi:hypothetical protein
MSDKSTNAERVNPPSAFNAAYGVKVNDPNERNK